MLLSIKFLDDTVIQNHLKQTTVISISLLKMAIKKMSEIDYYVTRLPNDETFEAAAYLLANTSPPRTPLIVMGL